MKEAKSWLLILLVIFVALTSLLIPFASGNIADGEMSVVVTVIVSVVATCSMLANIYIPIISSIISFGILILIGCPIIYSAEVFAIIPASIALFRLFTGKAKRQNAILVSTVSVTAVYVATSFYRLFANVGSISVKAFFEVYPETYELLNTALSEMGTINIAGKSVPIISSGNAEPYINLIVSLMPAITYVIVYIAFIVSTLLMKRFLSDKNVNIKEENWDYSTDFINFIYLIAAIITISLANETWLEIAMLSFSIIIGTQMVFDGLFSSIKTRIINGRRVFAVFRISVLALTFFFNPIFAPVEAVLFAGYDSAMRGISSFIKKHGGDDDI